MKTSENIWFSDIFKAYRNGTMALNGLIPSQFLMPCSMLLSLHWGK